MTAVNEASGSWEAHSSLVIDANNDDPDRRSLLRGGDNNDDEDHNGRREMITTSFDAYIYSDFRRHLCLSEEDDDIVLV